jgi:regulatory protein
VRRPASAADPKEDSADSPEELRARALRMLARREHARAELARKLAAHAPSAEALKALLDALAARKQLSDERFAEQRAHVLARKYGSARIRRELRARGISEEAAERVAAGDDDLARAGAILQRRYRQPAVTREERARRARFLQGRGFSYEVIRRVLDARDDDAG